MVENGLGVTTFVVANHQIELLCEPKKRKLQMFTNCLARKPVVMKPVSRTCYVTETPVLFPVDTSDPTSGISLSRLLGDIIDIENSYNYECSAATAEYCEKLDATVHLKGYPCFPSACEVVSNLTRVIIANF